MPSRVITTTSPFSTSRTNSAPMMSSAQVSEASTQALAELAEHERPDAEGIARADQLLVGEADQSIGAFDLEQRLDEFLDEVLLLAARHEMQDHLGVGGRLADGALLDEPFAECERVGEIAVMAEGEAAGIEIDEERLHVAQDRIAAGRVADMADGHVAFQPLDHGPRGEMVADEADAALGMEMAAVEADDARRFLAAMLERVQAKRGERRGIGMVEDAEDAALLVQPVLFEPAQIGLSQRINVLCHGRQPPPSKISAVSIALQCQRRRRTLLDVNLTDF